MICLEVAISKLFIIDFGKGNLLNQWTYYPKIKTMSSF
jgi:hypothetical protein